MQVPSEMLRRLQAGVRQKQSSLRWEENWHNVAWPLLAQK